MDREMTDRLIAMMSSENDTDAVMGLRGLQGLLRAEGVDFSQAVAAMIAHASVMKSTSAPAPAAPVAPSAPAPVIEATLTTQPPSVPAASVALNAAAPAAQTIAAAPTPAAPPAPAGALPQCSATGNDITLATPAGGREVITLPSEAAAHAPMIAESLTDAIVAAVINKSRLKLKLVDNKNSKGEVVETILRAEYDRAGMMPVQVWVNARGEVAALAAVLRKGLANAMPEIMAA